MTKIEIRQILCPTDFSVFSARAFEHALSLAAWYQAPITVLHVLPEPVVASRALAYVSSPMLLDASLRDSIQADLSSLVEPANRAGLHAAGELRDGEPAAEIVRVAQELHADLIVVGTHGRTGFQRWVLGSVAETVLRRAPCPVLTVPAHAADHPGSMFFKRILCATDFSPASEAAVRYASTLAAEADASLLLVHVLDRPGAGPEGNGRGPDFECAARAQLRRAVPPEAREWCQPEEIVTCGKAAPEVLRLAAEREAELIVMGVHGRSLLDLMAFGSVTHQVVREAVCPVLKSFDVPVLAGVDLPVATGETVAIVGPSGCGKSVLLKITIGLITPDSGDVLIDGESVFRAAPADLRRIIGKVGYVFQTAALFDALDVYENVAMGIREKEARSLAARDLAGRVARALRGPEPRSPGGDEQAAGGAVGRDA